MSRSLYWKPTKPGTCGGKGDVIDAITKAFGRFPEQLISDDVGALEIAQRFAHEDTAKSIGKLIDAIERHGEIDIEVVY